MVWYVIKLLILLPVLAGMIWGSVWLTRKLQGQMTARTGPKAARLVETTLIAPGLKLVVIEFHGREILVGAGRNGLVRLAESEPLPPPDSFPLVEGNL
jgi:flagellar protein FliO/FliZ